MKYRYKCIWRFIQRGVYKIKAQAKSFLCRIHWRKFITRKIIFITLMVIVLKAMQLFVHRHFIDTGAELTTSAMIEHFFFGIPFEKEIEKEIA